MNKKQSDFEVISKIIRNRRAIFPNQFNEEKISLYVIDEILEMGNWAPTHRRTEPWRYVLISGDGRTRLGDFLAEIYRELTTENDFNEYKFRKIKRKCVMSQYVILICMHRDEKGSVPEWEEIAATAMSVQNIWLACSTVGLGCYWSSPKSISRINEFTELGKRERCLGLLYIGGYDGPSAPGLRSPMANKVRYVTR